MAAQLRILLGLLLSPLAAAQSVPCAPAWQPTFGTVTGPSYALAGHDDGSGPALFAAGDFQVGANTRRLGKWDGTTWTWLGNFQSGSCWPNGLLWECGTYVTSLAEFDSGSGPELYVAGNFRLQIPTPPGTTPGNFIAKWDGSQWFALQSGLSGGIPYYDYYLGATYYYTSANALAVFDDGGGPDLYVGGHFTQAGPVPAGFIARWDGSAWSALGVGFDDSVYALAVYDDGGGPALYAAGAFTSLGATPCQCIAKWNGTTWSPLGVGTTQPGEWIQFLSVFDDGSGPALYAGGWFGLAPGAAVRQIAKWNGTTWSVLGVWNGVNDRLVMLNTLDDGTGPALYAGGRLTTAGAGPGRHFIRWNGTTWSLVGTDLSWEPLATTVYDIGTGPALYAGGWFTCPDSGDIDLARWAPPSGCLSSCEPGLGGVSACPCSNPPGGPDRGCENGAGTGGARLSVTGTSSLANDSLLLMATDEGPTASSIVLQGDGVVPGGITFGHGVRCAAGALKRLYLKTAVAGSISAPGAGDPSVSARSAALGDVISAGTSRHYGVYYRDPTILGGCPATSGFNVTQQLSVLWTP